MMTSCPICSSFRSKIFLDRQSVPIFQNRLLPTEKEAFAQPRGSLVLRVCLACGFVWNAAFEPGKVEYDASYDNSQNASPAFAGYLEDRIRYLIEEKGLTRSKIVEVGCGKGWFLQRLVEQSPGNTGVGYDTSYHGPTSGLAERLIFKAEYFCGDTALPGIDAIVCRHVIEHISDPVPFLRMLREALCDSPNATLYFETPCVDWILENKVVWDFFYEHCSYFTARSLRTAFELAGFEVSKVEKTFGGQYLWLEAKLKNHQTVAFGAGLTPTLADEFGLAEKELLHSWENKIDKIGALGRVAVWGAGAKGVTFVNLIDPMRESVACLVDINPAKQNMFVPITAHPVTSYKHLAELSVASVVLMNPNYAEEIDRLLKAHDINLRLWQ